MLAKTEDWSCSCEPRRAATALANRVWIIPGKRTKNKKEHAIPLTNEMYHYLTGISNYENLIGTNCPVFPNAKGTFISGFSSYKKKLDEQIKESGPAISPWRLHDLRRTFVTGLAKIGVGTEIRELIINHRKERLNGTYNTWDYFDEKKESLFKWEEYLWGLYGYDDPISAEQMRKRR